jgi:3-isopropylmalate dehydrogenase
MLLRYSLGLEEQARRIEAAVQHALAEGSFTGDIARPGHKRLTTREMTQAILSYL